MLAGRSSIMHHRCRKERSWLKFRGSCPTLDSIVLNSYENWNLSKTRTATLKKSTIQGHLSTVLRLPRASVRPSFLSKLYLTLFRRLRHHLSLFKLLCPLMKVHRLILRLRNKYRQIVATPALALRLWLPRTAETR
jgi:hypothetical protein